MLGFKTFISSIRQILNNKTDYIFLFYHFLIFPGQIRQINIGNNTNLVIYLIVTAAYYFAIKKTNLHKRIFIIISIFILMAVPSIMVFGYPFETLIGFILRIIIAYFIIDYFKSKFIVYFENLMFVLAYISIPLFIIQIIYPQFYNIFTPFSQLVLPSIYLDTFGNTFQYILIYGINGWGSFRNSGMFGEPSVYASMLAWAIIINLNIHSFQDNTKLVVFFLTSITLFSLGMFIYLIPIILIYIINNVRLKFVFYLIRVVVVIIILVPFLYRSPIIKNNIEMMSKKIQSEETNKRLIENSTLDIEQVSRFTGFVKNLEYFAKWPFGYGFFRSGSGEYKYLGSSPNSISVQIVNWGLAFIYILLLSAYRFSKILQTLSLKKNQITMFLTMIIFILPISGTSMENSPLYLAFLLWPILIYREFILMNTKKILIYNNQINR
jgi:hypothetical protein